MIKANSKLFLVLLLGVLSAFGPFVVDLYLPSLPQLASFFETSASMTQLTLTTAMIGLAVGQLLLGPLSDKFGRKIPLIISLVIYIISTVLIVYAPNIESMIVLRVIQGLSSAGSVVISRAVATDLYRGREMTRFFGLLMTINGIAPIISPILGSLLLEYISWKGVFVFLALIGVIVLLFCFRLKESLSIENLSLFGDYCFDGCKNVTIKNSKLLSKDAFWNCENILIEDCFIAGEYFGWNSKNVTLKNCKIESLQGFCYMQNLRLQDCELINTTLAFEYSDVHAEVKGAIDSVKNPSSGLIRAASIGELILDGSTDASKIEIITELRA